MDIQLNTLYVLTAGSYVHRDHQNVVVEFEKKVKATIPIHHLDALADLRPEHGQPGRDGALPRTGRQPDIPE